MPEVLSFPRCASCLPRGPGCHLTGQRPLSAHTQGQGPETGGNQCGQAAGPGV